MMQIKRIFFTLSAFCLALQLSAQGNWILPPGTDYTAVGSGDALYFAGTNGMPSLFFDEAGRRYELRQTIKKSVGYGLFVVEKDSLLGLVDAVKGSVLPTAFDHIQAYGPNFYEVDVYGASAVLNREGKQLISYQFKPLMPFPMGNDTLLMKYSLHPDAKAVGFLKDGKTLDPELATKLYPKDQAVRRAAMNKKPVDSGFKSFYEKGKSGLKTKDDQIVLPAEYDEVRSGYPGYFAVRKEKNWGLLKL